MYVVSVMGYIRINPNIVEVPYGIIVLRGNGIQEGILDTSGVS